jgi:hypothetical protein
MEDILLYPVGETPTGQPPGRRRYREDFTLLTAFGDGCVCGRIVRRL